MFRRIQVEERAFCLRVYPSYLRSPEMSKLLARELDLTSMLTPNKVSTSASAELCLFNILER